MVRMIAGRIAVQLTNCRCSLPPTLNAATRPSKSGQHSRPWWPFPSTKVVRHIFLHTAAKWLMQRRADKFESAGSLGMTMKTLESTYGRHHHPDHQSSVGNAFSKRENGHGVGAIIAVIVAVAVWWKS